MSLCQGPGTFFRGTLLCLPIENQQIYFVAARRCAALQLKRPPPGVVYVVCQLGQGRRLTLTVLSCSVTEGVSRTLI